MIEELLPWTSQQRKWLKTGLLEAFSFLLSLFVLLGASTPDRELLGLEMSGDDMRMNAARLLFYQHRRFLFPIKLYLD